MSGSDEKEVLSTKDDAGAVVEKRDSKKKSKKKKSKKKEKTTKETPDANTESMEQQHEGLIEENSETVEITNVTGEIATIDTTESKTDKPKKQKKSKKKKDKKKQKEKEKGDSQKESKKDSITNKDEDANNLDKRDSESDDENDDDDELLAAAALWADEVEASHTATAATTNDENRLPRVLSLHITQLPYDSTEFDLRKLFAEQGCTLTSVRLVYDRDLEGHKTVFRGVAFCDFGDAHSYKNALKLHHKCTIRGRKLNIRPCKSKDELAAIVARTQELVQEKIRHQRSLTNDGGATSNTTTSRTAKSSPGSNAGKKRKKEAPNKKDRKPKKPRLDKDGKPVKMTKKERNRKAAIIMQKRRRMGGRK